jgi:hypothetical protein
MTTIGTVNAIFWMLANPLDHRGGFLPSGFTQEDPRQSTVAMIDKRPRNVRYSSGIA